MKPDRNAPCPCGSGKKYKKCCGAAVGGGTRTADPFQQALAAFERGAMAEADAAGAVALRDHPEHPDVNHLCGLIAYRVGRLPEAMQRLKKAARLAPGNAFVHSNLSLVWRDSGDLDAAAESAHRAIALDATLADAHNNLGTVLKEQGDLRGAEACFRRASAQDARNPIFQSNLAACLLEQECFDEAESHFARAIELLPEFGPALAGLGALRIRQARWDEARALLERAIRAGAREPVVCNNLGLARHRLNDAKGAVEAFRQALERKPDYGGAYYNLGLALEDLGSFKAATEMYERALANGHRATDAVKSLMYAATRSGELDNAYRHAKPLLEDPALSADLLPAIIGVLGQGCDFAARRVAWRRFLEQAEHGAVSEPVLGEALMLSTYEGSLDEETVIRLHRSWARQVETPVAESRFREYPASRMGGRLRLAYLSPDFRGHSVGHFIRHVLAHHDRRAFEVICYSLTKREDEITEHIRGHVDRFLDVTALDDRELAQRIHADGVQVLVDLAGHSDGNRLRALALKPAPVQATWIGYLHTTGLEAMDWRITDPHADDPVTPHGTEKRMVLPESFLCFGAFPDTAIDPLPACHRHGHVTFASFNNLSKITAEAVRLWARILSAVPGSRMLIMATGAGSRVVADNLHAEFAACGIEPERLDLRQAVPRAEYFRLHNEVDIILDTFPFNGGTVTAGALWMGVPVVTLVGPAHRQRVSYSMLKNIGVEETIAWSEDEYVARAVALAADVEALTGLRRRIAEGTRGSILCNPQRFTRQLETALFQIWTEHRAATAARPH